MLLSLFVPAQATVDGKPNVVIILADDLGWGDVGAMDADSAMETPNIDRIAADGMRFTDAHSAAAVCTPSRYALMTGSYMWRTSWRKHGALRAWGRPTIDRQRPTVASLLRARGYATAVVGKWHLGLDLSKLSHGEEGAWGNTDFDRRIAGGPLARGFDEYFGIEGLMRHAPYGHIRDDRFAGTRVPIRDLLGRTISEAQAFLRRSARAERPFFLYLALTAPHKPIAPHWRFDGASSLGRYGEFVLQLDAAVGQIDDTLTEIGARENTLMLFTSDNGAYMDRVHEGSRDHVDDESLLAYRIDRHQSNGDWRGRKQVIFEGGHRVPMVVRWPGEVAAGSETPATVVHTDIYATLADLVGTPPAADGPRVVSIASDATHPAAGSFTATITFSEPVTGLGSEEIEVRGGIASNFAGGGSVYTVDIEPHSGTAGVVTVAVPVDAAENGNARQSRAFDVDTRAPTVLRATVHGSALALTWDEPLDAGSVPGPEAFALAGGDQSRRVTGLSVLGSTAVLTVAPAVVTEAGLVVSYTRPEGASAPVLRDRAGNEVADIVRLAVENETAASPSVALIAANVAEPVRAEFTATVIFSVPVTGLTAAEIEVSGGTVSSLAGSGAVYTLGIQPEADIEGEVSVRLPAGAAENSANQSSLGAERTFSADTRAPALVKRNAAVAVGRDLRLLWDESLDPASVPSADAFTVTGGDATRSVDGVWVEDHTVTLTLSTPVGLDEDDIALSYTAPSATFLRDAAGNAAADLSDIEVVNGTLDWAAAADDSVSLLPMLRGQAQRRGTPAIHDSDNGMFAIRHGPWKLVLGNGSGGAGEDPAGQKFTRPYQLFNLSADPTESTDVVADHPQVAERLEEMFEAMRSPTYDMADAPKSDDADLSALGLTGVDIGTFDAATHAYAGRTKAAGTTVRAVPSAAGALVAVSPADADPVREGHQVDLVAGAETVISVSVTAEDGNSAVYRMVVTRSATPAEVSVAAATTPVAEGTAAVFELTRTGSTLEALTVSVEVTESAAMLAADPPTSATFGAGQSSATLEVATEDDASLEVASAVTATIMAGEGYLVAADASSAQVTVEDNDAPVALTARFNLLPESHKGRGYFAARVRFSEPIHTSHVKLRDESFEVSGGRLLNAKRRNGNAAVWDLRVQPDSLEDVVLVLEPDRPCDDGGVCSADGKRLSNRLEGRVRGRTQVSITAVSTSVAEGTAADFELSRTGDASSVLTVSVGVSETGSMLAAGAPAEATFAAGSSTAALAAATEDDAVWEASSTVTASLASGSGYAVSPTAGSASVTVEDDDPEPQTLTGFTYAPARIAYGDAAPLLMAPAGASTEISYTATPAAVCTVDGTSGELTILGTGTCVVTATAAADANHQAASVEFTVTVVKATQTLTGFAYSPAAIEKGDPAPVLTAPTGAATQVTYAAATEVCTVDGTTGELTIVGAGDCVVTAMAAADANHQAASVEFTVTVAEAEALTAAFRNVPASHDGSAAFTLRLVFSEAIAGGHAKLRDESLEVTGGTATRARRVSGSSQRWDITVAPSSDDDVVLALSADRACDDGGVCTENGRRLSHGLEATVAGPEAEVSVSAATATVTEGAAASFDLSRTGEAASTLTVAVTVSETGSTLAAGVPTEAVFGAGSSTATLSVATEDDTVSEPSSTVTATLGSGTGYAVSSSAGSASVTVEDNDADDGGPSEGDIRLADGDTAAEGRVEVYLDGEWGTVCDDFWAKKDGRVACRQLGYPNVREVLRGAAFGQGAGPIWLDDVACRGDETRLVDCPATPHGVTNCGHLEDAGVRCDEGSDGAAGLGVPVLPAAEDGAAPSAPPSADGPATLADVVGAALSGRPASALTALDLTDRKLVDLRGVEALTGLERLGLRGNAAADLTPLSGLTGLKRLDVSDNDVVDLWPLSGLTGLERLDVSDNAVVDLTPLAGLPDLRVLLIDGNAVTDLSPLVHQSRLVQLGAARNRIAELSPLAHLGLLSGLDVSYNTVVDLTPLSGLRRLRVLLLDGNAVADLGPLRGLSSLTRLEAGGNRIVELGPLGSLSRLRTLNLSDNRVADVHPLTGLPELQLLVLRRNAVVDLAPVTRVPNLRWLDARGNAPDDAGAVKSVPAPHRLRTDGVGNRGQE